MMIDYFKAADKPSGIKLVVKAGVTVFSGKSMSFYIHRGNLVVYTIWG
jgi:hypothetical protein